MDLSLIAFIIGVIYIISERKVFDSLNFFSERKVQLRAMFWLHEAYLK